MNQVDLYINGQRVDLFQDEEISITLTAQNVQDLSKVFTDFSQSFTIPASAVNNQILSHYYRTDIVGAVDGRLRQEARIEINSSPFRTGVVEIENVQLKGTEPYAYTLTFYGDLVSLLDLFGEDYLYDLDLSAYDHNYDGATMIQGFDQDALMSGNLFYPLMSPVRNWVYNVSSASDPRHLDDIIAGAGHGHNHGVNYYEVKPAIKVIKLLEAMEAKYGISFVGDFMSDTQFNKLFLWAHRFQGYMYDSTNAIDWQLINMTRNTGSGSQFNLTTDTWTVASNSEYQLIVQIAASSANYELGLFRNGVQVATAKEDANAGTNTTFFDGYNFTYQDEIQLKIRPQNPANMTYTATDYTAYNVDPSTGLPVAQQFEVDQTSSATYPFSVGVSQLMPEIKVKDFLGGIIKMHNLVITANSETEFNLQTLNDWYADGVDQDLSSYINIEAVSVNRPSLYKEISFDYQDTNQILGYEYQKTNLVGYGDLNAFFSWDGQDYKVNLPFECPLFERLTDIDAGTLTNILVYKSQTREPDTSVENRFQPYLGSPILIYGEFSLDISANPISFVDESGTETQVNQVWYANTSSTSIGTGAAYALTWGSDIDPYYLTSIGKSLYQTYWEDYIVDLYDSKRRIVQVEAVLPLGNIITFDLKNKIIWNNQKWVVNSANINMTTGRAQLELLNEV